MFDKLSLLHLEKSAGLLALLSLTGKDNRRKGKQAEREKEERL